MRLANWQASVENHSLLENHGRQQKLLKIVHLDLCIVDVLSYGGSRYFITSIEDYNIKTWMYFLKHKLEACDAFKAFKAFVEK